MGIYSQIGTDGKNDVLESSNKGLNYLAGRKGDDTYIIRNLSNTVTYIDDSVISARNDDDSYEFWNKYLGDNPYFTPIEDSKDNGNDTLQINNIKANDLFLFFDVYNKNSQNNLGDDIEIKDGLFLFKKSAINSVKSQLSKAFSGKIPSNGMVRINAYFSDSIASETDSNSDSSSTEDNINYAENRIENIKTTQNGVEKVIDIEKYFKETQLKVREVLEKYGYSLASEMLMKANTKQRNELLNCYKTPMDLVITDTKNNDKIYAEAGADTIKLSGGNDIIYNTNSADKLIFQDKEVVFLTKNGNNLCINYNGGSVVLSNYYKSKASDRLDSYTDSKGEHSIKDQTIYVEGKGKIYGTEYNDEVYGSEKFDKIYGGGGNDKLYGDWGNDIIYSQSQKGNTVLLAGEEGNDKLYGGAGEDIFYFGEAIENGEGKDIIYNADSGDKLRFKDINFEDLKFTKSGNNLVITAPDASNLESDLSKIAYKNFQATISNYFKNDDKLDTIEFIKENNSDHTTTSSTAYIKDAKIHISGSGKINGTDFNEVITGSKKADKITSGNGDDTITAGKGNDTITLGKGNKTLNFSKGDGNDTIIIGDSTNNVYLKFTDIEDFKNLIFSKTDNNLIITSLYADSKGNLKQNGSITIKDCFKTKESITEIVNKNIFILNKNKESLNIEEIVNKGITVNANGYLRTLYGTQANDTFNIKSGTAQMYGGKGDDTYNIGSKRGYVNIVDDGGNDTINIDTKTSNLRLWFNVDSDRNVGNLNNQNYNSCLNASSLLILDKSVLTRNGISNWVKTGSVISNKTIEVYGIEDLVKTNIDSADNNYCIEDFNAKGANSEYESIDMQSWINQVASEVAGWLNDHSDYSSTIDVINSGNTTDINSLIKVYQTGSYQAQ